MFYRYLLPKCKIDGKNVGESGNLTKTKITGGLIVNAHSLPVDLQTRC